MTAQNNNCPNEPVTGNDNLYLGKVRKDCRESSIAGEIIHLQRQIQTAENSEMLVVTGESSQHSYLQTFVLSGLSYGDIWETCILPAEKWTEFRLLLEKVYYLQSAIAVLVNGGNISRKAPRSGNLVTADIRFDNFLYDTLNFLNAAKKCYQKRRTSDTADILDDIEYQLHVIEGVQTHLGDREDFIWAGGRPSDVVEEILVETAGHAWDYLINAHIENYDRGEES